MLGKFIGGFIGFAITQDVTGAVIGILLGLIFDSYFESVEVPIRQRDEWETEFSYLFVIMHAKFAKMDGRVTPEEIQAFQGFISVSKQDDAAVRYIYNQHRKSSDGFEHVAVRLAEMMVFDMKKLLPVLESLCVVMYATKPEGDLYQKAFIQAVARIFSVSDSVLDEMMSEVQRVCNIQHKNASSSRGYQSSYTSHDSAWGASEKSYNVLGLKKGANYKDVRSAYKAAIRKNHPDKVRGAGGSDKDVKQAEERLTEINEAYADLVSKLDG